jgi:hypothetical protein
MTIEIANPHEKVMGEASDSFSWQDNDIADQKLIFSI